MYCLSDVCFLCLNYENIVNLTVLQQAGNEIIQQVKFVLPEITILERQIPLLICSTCRQTFDAFHNFKKMCLDNTSRYNEYINKVQGVHGTSKGKFDDLEVKKKYNKFDTNVKEEGNIALIIDELKVEEYLVEDDIDVKEMLYFDEELSISKDDTNPMYQQIFKNETESNNLQQCDRNINSMDQCLDNNSHYNEDINKLQGVHGSSKEKFDDLELKENDNKFRTNVKEEGNIASIIDELKVEENLGEDDIDIKEMYFDEELSISKDDTDPLTLPIFKNETDSNNLQHYDRNINSVYQITEDKINSSDQETTKVTSEADLKCLVCPEIFVDEFHLQNHMMEHASVKDNKMFAKKEYMEKHTRAHTGRKRYKCSICNKKFTKRSAVKRHMQIHAEEINYKCSICNKMFATNQYLKRHMKTHTSAKDYKCSICNKMFAAKDYLQKHYMTHIGLKEYKCSICNKMFSQRGTLKRHMKIHTGEKDYKCSICNKVFIEGSGLKRHMTTHTDVQN